MSLKYYTRYFFCIITLLTFACNRQRNLEPYGWTPVSPEADSLVVALERAWLAQESDSVIKPLVDSLCTLAKAPGAGTVLAVRAHYWTGRRLTRLGMTDSGNYHYNLALQMNDSAAYPYETHRLLWATEAPNPPYDTATYDYLLNQYRFFKNAGDIPLSASYAMDMGVLMNCSGQEKRALFWLDQADSLFSSIGLTRVVLGNQLNRSTVLCMNGDTASAVAILRTLVADTIFSQDEYALNIAYNNLFIFGHDTTALFKAYWMVRDFDDCPNLLTLYEGALAGVMANIGRPDSGLFYARSALKNLRYAENRRHTVDILAWAAIAYAAAGDSDSAYILTERRLEEAEDLMEEARNTKVLNHDFNVFLTEKEAAENKHRHHQHIWLIAGAILFLAVILFVAWRMRRRWKSHAHAASQEHLDLEKSRRHSLAMQLALEQKETLIDNIRKNIPAENKDLHTRIETAIRAHNGSYGVDNDTFITTFTEIQPNFISALKESYPALTPADIRLASMIAIGLTNKQIAATLGIRPESVKQARWRLRTKMNLTPDRNLDTVLMDLNKN